MHTSGRILLLKGCALFALLLVRPAVAEPPPPLEWLREGTLKVTPTQPVKVQVLNRSSLPLDVRVALIPVDSSGTETAASFVTVTPATAKLGPGEAASFTISAMPEAKTPGTYDSVLVAYSDAPGSSIRRDVQLEVPSEKSAIAETPLTFLVKAMKLRTYLGLHSGEPMDDVILPVSAGAVGSRKLPEAYLVAEDGETAKLWLSAPQKLVDDVYGLEVHVDSVDQVGTYTGKLKVGDKDDETVTFTLTSAHHPVFAIVAVCVGILLAVGIQRYTGVLRLTWSLAQREAALGSKFYEAKIAFDLTAEGRPFASYKLSDFRTRKEALRPKIDALQRSTFTLLDTTNPQYKEIEDELKVLEAIPKQWEGFAAKLAGIEAALAKIVWDQVTPSLYLQSPPAKPALYDRMQQLLTGSAITVQKLGDLFAEASKGPDLLPVWEALNRRAAALHESLRGLQTAVASAPDSPPIQEARLSLPQAEASLVSTWNRLWIHADIDPAAQAGLETVENQLAIARTRVAEAEAREKKTLAPEQDVLPASDDLAELFDRLAVAAQGPATDAERVQRLQQRQRRAAIGVALVAFLIALYTGMDKYYVDKPFGRWPDYVDIVVWAVATQGLLDLLLRGLDRVWGLGGLFRSRIAPLS